MPPSSVGDTSFRALHGLATPLAIPTTGGWLSLLASTCHIDLRQFNVAATWLQTTTQLAKHAEHPEIAAWCPETEAWQAITTGDYRRALTLTQGGAGDRATWKIRLHPGDRTGRPGSRVWVRLGSGPETRDALNRVARLVAPLSMPEHPEHHYRYDPSKSEAYVATTLSWLGDPAAEPYTRQVLARMESAADGLFRPRRAAATRRGKRTVVLSRSAASSTVSSRPRADSGRSETGSCVVFLVTPPPPGPESPKDLGQVVRPLWPGVRVAAPWCDVDWRRHAAGVWPVGCGWGLSRAALRAATRLVPGSHAARAAWGPFSRAAAPGPRGEQDLLDPHRAPLAGGE